MARLGVLTGIFVLLIGLADDVSALDLTKWENRADVAIEEGAGEYCRLTLIPDIYDAARLDLGDIRLVDSFGKQVPYVLAKPQDITKRQSYRPTIINRSTNSEKAALVTLDFGEQVLKNSIGVITQGDNFRRAVKIEGSNDNIEFFTLVEKAYVFAVTQRNRFEKVDLPANDYRYLRISVGPMEGEEESPVIDEARAYKVEEIFAERQSVNMKQTEHSENEKNKSSIYVYDLVYRHLPGNEIKLDVADDSFYRYITVEGRDAAKQKVKVDSEDNRQRFREIELPWRRVINGTVYRYAMADGKKRERLALHIPSDMRLYRYMRITIKNYDDRPVTVNSASVEMIAHEMVFAVRDNTTAPTLYVGSESVSMPRYDLAYRLKKPLEIEARTARLSGLTANPFFGQVPKREIAWTEKHKVLLWIVMAVVVLVLAGFILKSFKSIGNEQAQG